jgi:hypothetical protein
MLKENYNSEGWTEFKLWERDRDNIRNFSINDLTIKNLGLSGAQWGAALNLATMFYMHGVACVMEDERVKDRHIIVSKDFPSGG